MQFLHYLFGEANGYVCIAYAPPTKSTFKQSFFQWPKQEHGLEAFVDQVSHGNNVWFCTSLMSDARRSKENALPGFIVWADLDGRGYNDIEPEPSCVVESSPGHFHVYWRMDKPVVAKAQEDYSKKMAYKYEGSDRGGWDLTQLLRVPYTWNYKPEYNGNGSPPMIEIIKADETLLPVETFDNLYVPDKSYGNQAKTTRPIPNPIDLPNAEAILYKFHVMVTGNEGFRILYTTEPGRGEDWSKKIWRLINICYEMGMEMEETFVIASTAKCNKYERDNRPPSHLWADVEKVYFSRTAVSVEDEEVTLTFPQLVESKEITNSFVEKYVNWATSVTDAPEQYHELCAVMLLSSLLSPCIELKLSWGTLYPNLWGMILGSSTLTRKTTAMNMAMNIIRDIDADLVFASDASPEGLLTGISLRPNRVSIFFRDEVAGLFKAINEKQYMSSLPEIFAAFYDVPTNFSRVLRKDTYRIHKPHFIIFCGGIKDKTYSLIEEEFITSGFIPRFLVVSGDTLANERRRTGRETSDNTGERKKIVEQLADLREKYTVHNEIKTPNGVHLMVQPVRADLTDEALELFGKMELKLEMAGENTLLSDTALPMFARQAMMILKLAMSFAATRRKPLVDGTLWIDIEDVMEGAAYIQKWGNYAVELLLSSSKTKIEKIMDKYLTTIKKKPGISQGVLNRKHHQRTRDGEEIVQTLMEWGLVYRTKDGKSWRCYPTMGET